MVNVDIDLFVSLILLGVLPEVCKGRVKQARTNGICIRHIFPLRLTRVEYLGKFWPMRYVGLNIEDVDFACGEVVEI